MARRGGELYSRRAAEGIGSGLACHTTILTHELMRDTLEVIDPSNHQLEIAYYMRSADGMRWASGIQGVMAFGVQLERIAL